MIEILLSALILFGNLTGGGGLSAVVDGTTTNAYYQGTSGWVGVEFDPATNITRAEIDSQSNGFDASGLTTTITLSLYARTSGTPANSTDGTLLGSTTFTDVNAITTKYIIPNDMTTEFSSAWWVIETGVWAAGTEIRFYTDGEQGPTNTPTPTPTPTSTPTPTATPSIPQVSSVVTLARSVNTLTPLNWYSTEVNAFRVRFHLTEAAGAIVMLHVDAVHRGDITGYTGVVGVGFRIAYRYSETQAGLDSASIVYPLNAVAGFNISERDPDHYGNTTIIDAWNLEPGYYEVTVFGSAHSTGSSADGLAGILAEGGDHGLNRLLIHIIPGLEVIE